MTDVTVETVAEVDLQVGTVHAVTWKDCCAAGHFTARLVEITYYIDEVDGSAVTDELRWNNGVTLEALGYGPEYRQVGEPRSELEVELRRLEVELQRRRDSGVQ